MLWGYLLLASTIFVGNGIKTYYVCGMYSDGSFENRQSNAWLLSDNNTLIDINGDQFKNNPNFLNYDISRYVGVMDAFHSLFKVEDRDIHESIRIDILSNMCQPRLNELYRKIMKYIK